MRRVIALFALFGLLLSLAAVSSAQDSEMIVTGLTYPRGIAFDSAGSLYVTEVGTGGDVPVEGVTDEFGQPLYAGATSRLSLVSAEGDVTVLLDRLPSFSNGPLGLQNVFAEGDTLWLVMGEGPQTALFNWAVLALDANTYRVRTYIDILASELANNPDGTEEIYSNPTDIAFAPDGTLHIVDTGGNTVYLWTPETGLAVFKTWDNNPVPSAISFAADGSLYVSFLGQGIAPGSASIQHLDASGAVLETYEGLNAITDILVASDGAVYFVELFGGVGAGGPQDLLPGRVSSIVDGEIIAVAEGLVFPYALAEAPDGSLAVSVGSVFVGAEMGGVMRVAAN